VNIPLEHLFCTECEAHPTVARIDGWNSVVCHCTHVDGDLDARPLHKMGMLPEPWEFRETGGEET
jgi:hypothetical protein